MLGSLQKKGNTYYVVFDEGRDSVTNKRIQKWVSLGTKDKTIAESKYSDMVKKIHAGDYQEPTKMTVKEYLLYWLDKYAKKKVRHTTYNDYERIVKQHLIPAVGNIPLAKLQPLQVQDLIDELASSDLASSSVRKSFAVFRKALNQAIKWRLLTFNPCSAAEPPRLEKYKAKVYTPAQLQCLLEIVEEEDLNLPVIIAVTCGLRRGEICGLRWEDVNMDKGLLFVRHSMGWQDNQLILKPVKTQSSERSVRLPPLAIAALRKEKIRQNEDKLRAGGLYQKGSYVWAWDDGRPHRPDYLYSKFQKVIKAYNKHIDLFKDLTPEQKEEKKLPLIRFHDLRHSHATALLLAGINTKIISERLGHSSTRITEEIYSHVLPEMQEKAANAIETLLTKSVK